MKTPAIAVIIIAVGALAVSGCDEHASMEEGAMSDMPAGASSDANGEHVALGVVNSIDIESGTINISHDPVESAGWAAMTMPFRLADPSLVNRVEPGQRIRFRFTTDDGGTVTAIQREP